MAATYSAIPDALDGAWLSIDTQANQGSGKYAHEPDTTVTPNPAVPTNTNPLPADIPNAAPVSTELYYSDNSWGPWPTFSQTEPWKRGPIDIVEGPPSADPDGYAFGYDRRTNQDVNLNEYAG